MTKPHYSSSALIFSALYLNVRINGWMPRPRISVSSNRPRGVRTKTVGGGGIGDAVRQQNMSLSASGNADDDHRDIDSKPRLPGDDEDEHILPLFAQEGEKRFYQLDTSRLEAIYNIDSEHFNLGATSDIQSNRLLGEERVKLGHWMSWDEGKCLGDLCGDEFDQCDIPEEYKIAYPSVDVMSFLGIRRAEPVQVCRDWD